MQTRKGLSLMQVTLGIPTLTSSYCVPSSALHLSWLLPASAPSKLPLILSLCLMVSYAHNHKCWFSLSHGCPPSLCVPTHRVPTAGEQSECLDISRRRARPLGHPPLRPLPFSPSETKWAWQAHQVRRPWPPPCQCSPSWRHSCRSAPQHP